MKQLSSFEQMLAKAHEGLPHTPKGLREWVVNNAWWLALIGVILGVLGVISTLFALTAGTLFVTAVWGVALGASMFTASMISLLTLAVMVGIQAMAIKPLQAKQKRGWDLVFLAALVGIAGNLLSVLVGGTFGTSLAGLLIATAVAYYVLFELRGHYLPAKKGKK